MTTEPPLRSLREIPALSTGNGTNGRAPTGAAAVAVKTGAETRRLHDLDAMRGVLMSMGVVLHAALPFSVNGTWLVADPAARWGGFDALVWCIHLFRMPAFFILAGYFASMTLTRHGVRAFARLRAERLLIPLFFTALLVNSLQLYLLTAFRTGQVQSLVDFVKTTLLSSWAHLQGVSHLWFLVLAALYQVIPVILSVRSGGFGRLTLGVPKGREQLFMLLLLPLYPVLLRGIGRQYPPVVYWSVGDVISGIQFYMYVPYFVFGVWLFAEPTRLDRFARPKLWHLLLAVPAAFCVATFAELYPSFVGRALFRYGREALAWLACLYCFWIFRRFFSHKSRVWARFSDASYTIYLFHHVLVMTYAYLIIQTGIPIGLKFLIVASLTYITAYGLHRLAIRRVLLLSWMFNGKSTRAGASLPDA